MQFWSILKCLSKLFGLHWDRTGSSIDLITKSKHNNDLQERSRATYKLFKNIDKYKTQFISDGAVFGVSRSAYMQYDCHTMYI